jgi:hypothetical protein
MTEVKRRLEILANSSNFSANFEAKDRFLADFAFLMLDPALD